MKHRKLTAGLLAGAMAFAMAIPAFAEGETTTDITLALCADYVMTVPAATTVTQPGMTNLTNGLKVECTTHNFRADRKVCVGATSSNNWALKCDSNTVSYKLYDEEQEEVSDASEIVFVAEDINAEDGATNAVYVDLGDVYFSELDSGTYTDTITWTGEVDTCGH